jgi:pre-mRNA-splicing factor SYF1
MPLYAVVHRLLNRANYCSVLMMTKKGTATRRAFDRALQSLPITQHGRIWDLYIEWVTQYGIKETSIKIFHRYLMFDASKREVFVSYLLSVDMYEEAARQIAICVDDDHYISPSGQSKHHMWMQLCDICANHPLEVAKVLNVEAIIRGGIARFSDEVGRLWCRLSDFYVKQGEFEKARDIYEEAINTVTTVRDFTIVFDTYIKVEESILTQKMRAADDDVDDDDDDDDAGDSLTANDVEMRLARLEFLMDKRPILLNSVILRQNPHNVHEWHKRIKLLQGDPQRALMTYIEAVKTVDSKLAVGKLSSLWLSLAKYYERHKEYDNARTILAKATEVDYRHIDELANVWCAWAEMEMRLESYEQALSILQRAVTEPKSTIKRRKALAASAGVATGMEASAYGSVADRLYKNVKVWSLYLDLEESLGTIETCRAAYDRVMDLKVVTAQMALNYASFLEENNFFEDSFRVYERSVQLFSFPQVKTIWLTYLDKFLQRYEGTKLERLRDLFEQAVEKVPADDASLFYIKYAKAEELYGMARHAMAIYDRATRVVPESKKLDLYRLYIKKVEQHYGITRTRPVYERAVAELSDNMCMLLCIEYADMERKLGEIDRARAILQHGSQFADPRRERSYWSTWKEFEEAHGNEDTFRDMLRVQRSVETAFSQVKRRSFNFIFFFKISRPCL